MKYLIILLGTLASVSSYGQPRENYDPGPYALKRFNPASLHRQPGDTYPYTTTSLSFHLLNAEGSNPENNHSPSFLNFMQPQTDTGFNPLAGFYYSRNPSYLQAKGSSRTLLWPNPIETIRPFTLQASLADSSAGKSDPTHSHSLDYLTNVNTKGKISGDLLRWNAATGLWDKFTPDYLTIASGDARYPRFEHMHDASAITSGTFYSTRYGAGSIPTASIQAANGGTAGKILSYGNGWIDPNSLRVAPAGSSSQLQFNNGSAFHADNTLTFQTASKVLGANFLSLNAGLLTEQSAAVLTIPTMQSFGNFRHTVSQAHINEDGQRDAVYQWGYNQDGIGSRVNSKEASFHYALESHYLPYPGAPSQFEIIWQTLDLAGNTTRNFGMNISKANGTSNSYWRTDGMQWFAGASDETPYFTIGKGAATVTGTTGTFDISAKGGAFLRTTAQADGSVNITNYGTGNLSYNTPSVSFLATNPSGAGFVNLTAGGGGINLVSNTNGITFKSHNSEWHMRHSEGNPLLQLKKTNAPLNQKIWEDVYEDSAMVSRVVDDAYTLAAEWMRVTRSGNSISEVEINAPLTVHGLIHPTEEGIKFPDGTVQVTAATNDHSAIDVISFIDDNLVVNNGGIAENAMITPVSLEANTNYLFEGQYIIHSQGNSQRTGIGFALQGGSSVISVDYVVTLSTSNFTHPGNYATDVYVSGIEQKMLNTTSQADYTIVKYKGIWKHKEAGEVMPQVNFSAKSGSNILKPGSYIRFTKVTGNRSTFF